MANERSRSSNYAYEEVEYEDELVDEGFPRRRPGGAPGGPPGRREGGRFRPRRKVCSFCVEKTRVVNYKEVDTLRRFVDDHGKILPRRKTGTCARHQRRLAVAIKQARHLAMLPFTARMRPYQG
jgi:small subunit ribosomal protein S18